MGALTKFLNVKQLSGSVGLFTGTAQLFVLLIAVFIFLYGVSVGKTRALVSLLGIFIAFALTLVFPFTGWLKGAMSIEEYYIKAGIFAVAYVAVFVLINMSALRNRLSMGETSFVQVLAISIIQVGFLGAVILSFLPRDILPKVFNSIYPFLGTQKALFFWALASLAILPFMRGSRRSSVLAK